MLQFARLSTELKNAPVLLEASPLQGAGMEALKACVAETKPGTKLTMMHHVQ